MVEQPILIIPGINNSGPQHWQSIWEALLPNCQRVQQQDWDQPLLADWLMNLDQAIESASNPPILVAHSLGCALVGHWSRRYSRPIKGALLVAPSDIDRLATGSSPASSFAPMAVEPLPFPSIVAASSDDPYYTLERAEFFASAWRSEFVNVGALGHINSSSGLGEWQQGQALLQRLISA